MFFRWLQHETYDKKQHHKKDTNKNDVLEFFIIFFINLVFFGGLDAGMGLNEN